MVERLESGQTSSPGGQGNSSSVTQGYISNFFQVNSNQTGKSI